MEFGTWILLVGVVIAALGVMAGGVTGIVVVARFIFRLDANVDRLEEKIDQLAVRMERAATSISKIADSIVSLIERTAKIEGRVDELSCGKRD